MPLVNIHLDGIEVQAESAETILQVAARQGIHIPTLCHDERVKIYASCGICLVEAEPSPRLVRACSTFPAEGMNIRTNTDRVKSARKAALELLFSAHKGDCRPPCILACPGQTDCQGYIGLIANRQYKEAVELMKEKLPLPSSIGRVCPHPCETACRCILVEEPVSIAHLKYFASDKFLGENVPLPEIKADTGKSVAIIGGGPGGLTAAYFLRRLGHSITVYDAMPQMGGMLRYGIPEYRLPKKILDSEISVITKMGVKFINNAAIGPGSGRPELTLEQLQKNHDAVLVAIGAWSSMKLNCPGEELKGVIGGIDFLRDVALGNAPVTGNRVAIVGGGNTAMDACRTAVRLGAKEVYNIYRRTRDEMPAEKIEIDEAEEEGVVFRYLTNPIEIIEESGRASAVRLQKMKLGDPDASGRRSPVPIEGEKETLTVDIVIIAIGQIAKTGGFEELTLTKRKTIASDESTYRTNLDGVFAIGDAVNKGADIAISAIGAAKKAVSVIDGFLNGDTVSYTEPYLVKTEPTADDYADRGKKFRAKMRHLNPAERRTHFGEVNAGFSEDEAVNEAMRCLECGCADFFECKLIGIADNFDNLVPSKYNEKTDHAVSAQEPVNNNHPFIHRNPDKCILCGLCVRICEELMGVTALGLLDRGFDTAVGPAFNTSLEDGGCISCGQCVSVCPTGALTEKITLYKPVPLDEDYVQTVCSFCSVGCNVKIGHKGNMILRCLPDNSIDREQILCARGRFGFIELAKKERITKPQINKTEAGFQEAAEHINKRIQDIITKHGSEAVAICVSGRLTNEEITLAKKYADILGTRVYSFERQKSPLAAINGKDASTCGFEELQNADVILLAADDIMESHPVAGIYIRKAVHKGAKLILVSRNKTGLANEWCDMRYDSIELAVNDEMYKKAQKQLFVFEQNALTETDGTLLANFITSGAEIIQLKPSANSQGLADLNIGFAADITEKINSKTIKGLIVFSEDLSGLENPVDLSGLEFLCVGDAYLTETAKKANAILPCTSFAESSGTYTNTTGEIKMLNCVNPPAGSYTNSEIIQCLINAAGK